MSKQNYFAEMFFSVSTWPFTTKGAKNWAILNVFITIILQ